MPIHRYDEELQVGKPYVHGRTNWPEHVEYSGFRSNGHLLRMFLPSLSAREIADVAAGEAEFALYVQADVLFLLYRFGDSFPWSNAPHSWHLVDPREREVPGLPQQSNPRDPLFVVLVEATDGIVRVVRKLWLSPEFSLALRMAIQSQAVRPWPGDREYDRQIDEAYSRYPTPEAMLRDAMVQTKGSDW